MWIWTSAFHCSVYSDLRSWILTAWSCCVPVGIQYQPVSLLLSPITRCLCVKLLHTLLTLTSVWNLFMCIFLTAQSDLTADYLFTPTARSKSVCWNRSGVGTTLVVQRTSNSSLYSWIVMRFGTDMSISHFSSVCVRRLGTLLSCRSPRI